MEPNRTTKQGTPLSPKWDDEWVAEVEYTEQQLNRRICGAHAPDHTPCQLASTHKNGRCRYHGGLDGIGAPFGNRNAIIHGLYSRRLQQCGEHCALWQTCPMPNKDIEALPHKKRPHCVYERKEYDSTMASFPRSLYGLWAGCGVANESPPQSFSFWFFFFCGWLWKCG